MSYYVHEKNVNNFQTAKVQLQGDASHLLNFWQCQSGVAYKNAWILPKFKEILGKGVPDEDIIEAVTRASASEKEKIVT